MMIFGNNRRLLEAPQKSLGEDCARARACVCAYGIFTVSGSASWSPPFSQYLLQEYVGYTQLISHVPPDSLDLNYAWIFPGVGRYSISDAISNPAGPVLCVKMDPNLSQNRPILRRKTVEDQ